MTYSDLSQHEKALLDLNKAIELYPNFDNAYSHRGRVYYCLKQYERAIQDLNKALELNPNHEAAKNNLKLCREAMGN